MGQCEKCSYGAFPRMQRVAAHAATLAVVGESVTISEIRAGHPFIGPGADVLKKTMQKVGLPIDESTVYFTSALKCRPAAHKAISKEAIRCCRPILIAELKAVNPTMIITLGNTATQMLMNDTGLKITALLGHTLKSADFPDVTVVPCYNPAMILRTPPAYKIFQQVLGFASGIYNNTKVLDPGATDYDVLRTQKEVADAVVTLQDEAQKSENGILFTGNDIETTGLDPREEQILNLGISYSKNKVFVLASEAVPYANLILGLKMVRQIWHNGKFDTSFLTLRKLCGFVHEDDMLLHYCLNENWGTHDLGQLSTLYLGADEYKSKANAYIKSEHGFASADEKVQLERVAIDADYTRQLFFILHQLVWSSGAQYDEYRHMPLPSLQNVYENLLIPGSDLLRKIELHGMLVDVPRLESMRVQYDNKIAAMLDHIGELADGIYDRDLYMQQTGAKSGSMLLKPTSTPQMAWLVYDRLKMRPPQHKKRSTDSKTLLSLITDTKDPEEAKHLLDQRYPLFGSVLDFRIIRKEQSTYVIGALKRMDKEHRVHSNFSMHRTSTGRLSSKDPNVQNIPSDKLDVRRCYIAPPGYKLMECDYQGAELRIMAYLSNDKNLIQVFKDGRNLHNEVATRFYGPNFTHANKMAAKTIDFGIPYGRKAFSIALQLGITVQEAQQLINEWFNMFPEVHKYLLWCDEQVRQGKVLVSPLGRMRRFGLITADTLDGAQNEGRNVKIQATASDMTFLSAIRIYDTLAEKYDTHIIDLIHDSILSEVPDDPAIINTAAKYIQHEMCETPKIWLNTDIPFGVDVDLGANWGDVEEYKVI